MLKLEAPSMLDCSIFENRDLSKGTMHVETYDPHLRLARLRRIAGARLVDQTLSEHRAAEGPADERCHHRLSQYRAPLSLPNVRKTLDGLRITLNQIVSKKTDYDFFMVFLAWAAVVSQNVYSNEMTILRLMSSTMLPRATRSSR